jgi:hypothetical protein
MAFNSATAQASRQPDIGGDIASTLTGREALRLLERGECFGLLFTDVVLSRGMSSVELFTRCRCAVPGAAGDADVWLIGRDLPASR